MTSSPEGMEELRQQIEDQAKGAAKKYVVKGGDTLSSIAKEMLGDADRWPEIVKANKDKIDDPDQISAGMELDIPT